MRRQRANRSGRCSNGRRVRPHAELSDGTRQPEKVHGCNIVPNITSEWFVLCHILLFLIYRQSVPLPFYVTRCGGESELAFPCTVGRNSVPLSGSAWGLAMQRTGRGGSPASRRSPRVLSTWHALRFLSDPRFPVDS
jgi:hypothetical protein